MRLNLKCKTLLIIYFLDELKGELDDLLKKLNDDPKIVKAIEDLKKFINDVANSKDAKEMVELLRKIADALEADESVINDYPSLEEFAKTTVRGLRFIAKLIENGTLQFDKLSFLTQLLAEQLDTVTADVKKKGK